MVIYNWPSIIFFAVLYAVSIAAIIVTIVDKTLPIVNKVVWVAVILILPLLGVLAWAINKIYKRWRRTPATP